MIFSRQNVSNVLLCTLVVGYLGRYLPVLTCMLVAATLTWWWWGGGRRCPSGPWRRLSSTPRLPTPAPLRWVKHQLEPSRVAVLADPVHFLPDPDPANYLFKTGSRILLALKESIPTSNFFCTSNIFLLIFEWWIFLSEKMEKFTWKCVKPLCWTYFFLVYTTLHCQSTNRIRIRNPEPSRLGWEVAIFFYSDLNVGWGQCVLDLLETNLDFFRNCGTWLLKSK